MSLLKLKEDLKEVTDLKKAKFLQRFFKTGEGQYGYGDLFIGITVPQLRVFSKNYQALLLEDVILLLRSKIHEERLLALFILVDKFKKGSDEERKNIFDFYLNNTHHINNWDLVDSSADKIVGEYLINKDREILLKLATSKDLWERRIAIMATYQFIKKNSESEWTLKIAEILVRDPHDLIQKAVGWMLREVGKRCSEMVEEEFLKKHLRQMPRTMLRYATERFPKDKRQSYLKNQTSGV